jgi:hypothetical protein
LTNVHVTVWPGSTVMFVAWLPLSQSALVWNQGEVGLSVIE